MEAGATRVEERQFHADEGVLRVQGRQAQQYQFLSPSLSPLPLSFPLSSQGISLTSFIHQLLIRHAKITNCNSDLPAREQQV